jgi:hypothetical protein
VELKMSKVSKTALIDELMREIVEEGNLLTQRGAEGGS